MSLWGSRDHPAALVACSSRRRRRKVNAGDSSSWASLHEDLVSLIGWRVLAGDFRDYIRFRAVCPHWRSSTTCPRGRGIIDPRFYPRGWMLLPEGRGLYPGHGKLRSYVRFFNLSTGAFVRVRLPLFKDHCVLYSVDGILLLQRDHDTAICLLHPFSGDTAEFPPLETLLPQVQCRSGLVGRWALLRHICGASISVGADGLVRVMMHPSCVWNICFATSGDQQWRVTTAWERSNIAYTLPFQGKLYVLLYPHLVRSEHEVIQFDPPQQEGMEIGSLSEPSPKLIARFEWPTSNGAIFHHYGLVECNSEIFVIGKKFEEVHCLVYRLADLMLGKTVPLTSIDGNAFFIGPRSLCVSSKVFPTIVPDTILLPDPNIYLIQYNLSNGTLSQATDGVIASEKGYPGPYSIMCHIITCCYPKYWNKGKILCKDQPKWKVKKKFRIGVKMVSQLVVERGTKGQRNYGLDIR